MDAWHGFFNLPDGNCNLRGDDELRHMYVVGGERRYLLDITDSRFGDVQVGVARFFGAARDYTLKVGLKLPSGDSKVLTGSGASDLSVSLLKRSERVLAGAPGGVYRGTGALRLGESGAFAGRNEDWAAFGVFGGGWQPLARPGLKAHLDAHSAFYRCALDELGGISIQASLGVRWELGSGLIIENAVSEDVAVKASPDCAIHAGFSWRH